jgi:hypothetical protein
MNPNGNRLMFPFDAKVRRSYWRLAALKQQMNMTRRRSGACAAGPLMNDGRGRRTQAGPRSKRSFVKRAILKTEVTMFDMDSLFSGFPNSEMIPVMKRAFGATSATIHKWGSCGAVFTDDEAEMLIANNILTLVQDGVTDADMLRDLALSHFGFAALDKVAQDMKARMAPEAMKVH